LTSRFTKNALGVGLAIAKRLVQLHAGSIEAHWRGLGYGAEFVVRLPLVPPPKPAPARERQPPLRPAGRRLKVLVVEDNHDLVQMLEWAVKGMGQRYAARSTGGLRFRRLSPTGPMSSSSTSASPS
jgi:hypothetical protein